MRLLNFFEVPRSMGNPFQRIVKTEEELLEFIKENDGKEAVFTSHNSYPILENGNPYQINVNKIFIDLDDDRKPENALLDLRTLNKWCINNGLSSVSVFSGSKGFHLYIILKEQKYLHNQYLVDVTKAIHIWLKKHLKLRTLCDASSDPKRLCRVWYTKHAKRDKKTGKTILNGNTCYPLHPDWINKHSMQTIIDNSKNPKPLQPDQIFPTHLSHGMVTLDGFVDKFKIDVDDIIKSNASECTLENINQISKYQEVNDPFIKKIIPKMCMHTQIIHNPNPPHFIRFNVVVQLKKLGYSRKWIFDFIQDRSYVDGDKVDVCAYQINQIFTHSPHYTHATCTTIYRKGFCIGAICPQYSKFGR